jgi:glycosyltransferase involved in cell wall biosynthesis
MAFCCCKGVKYIFATILRIVTRTKFHSKQPKVIFLGLFSFFCICIAVVMFYHLFFHVRLFGLENIASEPTYKPLSIIIVANNEFENLELLVPALLSQDYPEYEVILVDDRSEDETYENYLALSKTEPNLKFIRIDQTPETSSAKKFALTLAIKAAKYEHLLFTDADCLPTSSNWVKQMSGRFVQGKEIVLGVSPYETKRGFLNKIIQFETGFTAMQYLSFCLAGVPYMAVGRNWAFCKHLFLDSKGYHPYNKVIGGDDDLFFQKVATNKNTAVCIQKYSFMLSKPKSTFSEWVLQKKRHYAVGKYYNFRTKFLLGLFHFALVCSYVLGVVMLFSEEYRLYSLALFAARLLLFWIFSAKLFEKLSCKVDWYLIPWIECLFSFITVVLGISALRSRKVKWR